MVILNEGVFPSLLYLLCDVNWVPRIIVQETEAFTLFIPPTVRELNVYLIYHIQPQSLKQKRNTHKIECFILRL